MTEFVTVRFSPDDACAFRGGYAASRDTIEQLMKGAFHKRLAFPLKYLLDSLERRCYDGVKTTTECCKRDGADGQKIERSVIDWSAEFDGDDRWSKGDTPRVTGERKREEEKEEKEEEEEEEEETEGGGKGAVRDDRETACHPDKTTTQAPAGGGSYPVDATKKHKFVMRVDDIRDRNHPSRVLQFINFMNSCDTVRVHDVIAQKYVLHIYYTCKRDDVHAFVHSVGTREGIVALVQAVGVDMTFKNIIERLKPKSQTGKYVNANLYCDPIWMEVHALLMKANKKQQQQQQQQHQNGSVRSGNDGNNQVYMLELDKQDTVVATRY